MQKKTRDEWKKVVTGMKEALGVEYKTRHITSTAGLKEAVKDIALKYARGNRNNDPYSVSEDIFLKTQILELQSQVNKYKALVEEVKEKNNTLKERYEEEKNKSWFRKIWG